jgi:N-acetylneuraminic acid mutarotase
MIVWGGYGDPDGNGPMPPAFLNTGGIYDPETDTWTALNTTGAPSPRKLHAAVWAGEIGPTPRMVVWGGYGGGTDYPITGGMYDPALDTWTAMDTTGAPTGRYNMAAAWMLGHTMVVWGGWNHTAGGAQGSGGRFQLGVEPSGLWQSLSTSGAPPATSNLASTHTGSSNRLLVFGGSPGSGSVVNTGGQYDPSGNAWTSMSTTGAPTAREAATMVWTGSRAIVWGGAGTSAPTNTGGIFNPTANAISAWLATSSAAAPLARSYHTAVWTGSRMIVWGGYNNGPLGDGAALGPVSVYVKQ